MFNFFGKRNQPPKVPPPLPRATNVDPVLLVPQFVEIFLGKAGIKHGLPFESEIPRQRLDFSTESLHALDKYLDTLHRNSNELSDSHFANAVLTAGSYLGEVIRRNAPLPYKWTKYEDYFPKHPELAARIERNLTSSVVLVRDSGAMTMPINKIARYILEGAENNTHFYVDGEIKSCLRSSA